MTVSLQVSHQLTNNPFNEAKVRLTLQETHVHLSIIPYITYT